MKLIVPLPGCLKFKKIFDDNEYLQFALKEDRDSISVWYINDDCDMQELKRILVTHRINYKIRKCQPES